MALSAAEQTAASAFRPRIADCLGTFAMALLAVVVVAGPSARGAEGPAGVIPKDERPTLLIAPTLVVDPASNSASGLLYLRNNSKSPTTFSLTAEDFVSKTTGKRLGAKTSFAAATADGAGKPLYETTSIPAESNFSVKVDVANLWEAGESEAALLNKGRTFGVLKAVKYRVPFAVKLEGGPDVTFERGKTHELTVKNDDGMNYPVEWKLAIGDAAIAGRSVMLAAQSPGTIRLQPPNAWFGSLSGRFKDDVRDGALVLMFRPAGMDDSALASKTLSLKAHLRSGSETQQKIFGTGLVFFALLAGGLCSLMLRHWLPNKLAVLELKEKLATLTEGTRALAGTLDSSLRVLVRVQRKRLTEMLRSHSMLSPDLPATLAQTGKGIALLEQKLNLLERIDRARADTDGLRAHGGAPSLADEIDAKLRKAAEKLRSVAVKDEDLQAAQKEIDDAEKQVQEFDKSKPEFAQELVKRFAGLAVAFKASPTQNSTRTRIEPLLPALFNFLATQPPVANDLAPNQYALLDTMTLRLELARNYINLYEGTGAQDRAALDKLEAGFCERLNTDDWQTLRAARLSFREMKAHIFSDRLEAAIREKRLYVQATPEQPVPYQPVRFQVGFVDTELNKSAAQERLTCSWTFIHPGGRLGRDVRWKEFGWDVWHYFPEVGDYIVEVKFENEKGETIQTELKAGEPQGAAATHKGNKKKQKQEVPGVVPTEIGVQPDQSARIGDRTRIEALRFVIVLVATLLGLIAGAQEQLAKLDLIPAFIAIFLVGFTADTIKNLLTAPAAATQPNPPATQSGR